MTRKITKGLSRIKCRLQSKLILGNLNAKEIGGMQEIMQKCNG